MDAKIVYIQTLLLFFFQVAPSTDAFKFIVEPTVKMFIGVALIDSAMHALKGPEFWKKSDSDNEPRSVLTIVMTQDTFHTYKYLCYAPEKRRNATKIINLSSLNGKTLPWPSDWIVPFIFSCLLFSFSSSLSLSIRMPVFFVFVFVFQCVPMPWLCNKIITQTDDDNSIILMANFYIDNLPLFLWMPSVKLLFVYAQNVLRRINLW